MFSSDLDSWLVVKEKKNSSKGVEQERKQARMSRGGVKDKGQEGIGIKRPHLQGQLCIFSQSITTIQFLIGSKKTLLNCWSYWPAEKAGKMRKTMSIV